MSPKKSKLRYLPVLLALASCLVVSARATAADVITGIIDKVDSVAKTIAVKTADGTVQTVKFTDRTTVRGLKGAAKGADLAGKEGSHVIIHTTGEGAENTADSVLWFGDKAIHTTEGTVDEVGAGSKTVAVKTADGTKETLEVADHATVETGKSVARYSAQGAKKGEHVTVYYTEEAGKKVAHFFKRL